MITGLRVDSEVAGFCIFSHIRMVDYLDYVKLNEVLKNARWV